MQNANSQTEKNQPTTNDFLKIIKNIGWLTFGKLFGMSTGLFVSVWVARYLGPASLGLLAYALSFVALFSFISVLGLEQIVVRELVKSPQKKDVILGTAFILRIAGGIISFLIAMGGIVVFGPDNLELILYVAIIAFGNILQAFDVIDTFFQYRILSRYSVVAKNTAFIIVSILKIYFILNKCPLLHFVWAAVFEIFFSSCLLVIAYRICHNRIRQWKFDFTVAKALFLDAWPLMSGIFFVSIYMRIDQIMIGNYLDSSALGIYSVAVYLSQAWYFFPIAIVKSVFPYLIELREKDNLRYQAQLQRMYSLMFWMGAVAGIFFTLFGKSVIVILYGSAYAGSYPALMINIWSGMFVAQSVARGIWIVAENLQRFRLIIQIVVAVGNVLGNMYLIPLMGIKGAALATLLSQALGTWGITLLIRPLRASTLSMIRSINPMYIFLSRRQERM